MKPTQEEYPEYMIKSFSDFCNIPADKLDACLEDFKLFINHAIGMKNDIESIAQTAKELGLLTEEDYPDGSDAITFDRFTWIDDGKHEITKTVRIREVDSDEDSEPFLTIKQTEDSVEVSGSMIDAAQQQLIDEEQIDWVDFK